MRKYFWRFMLPSFLGVMVFSVLPFLDMVKRSFTTAVTGSFCGLDNYRLVFTNQAFGLAVINTLSFAAAAIPLLVAAGLLLALPLSRLKSGGLIKALYLFPYAMPTATVALVWKMFLKGRGLPELLAAYLWKNTGYTLILWLAGIWGFPGELIEAAKVDGAGIWQRLWKVVLPNLKGTLYTILILSFLNIFKIYREAYLVAGAYPDSRIYMLQHLFNNWFLHLEFDKMAAAAVCVSGFLLVFILLLLHLWDKD